MNQKANMEHSLTVDDFRIALTSLHGDLDFEIDLTARTTEVQESDDLQRAVLAPKNINQYSQDKLQLDLQDGEDYVAVLFEFSNHVEVSRLVIVMTRRDSDEQQQPRFVIKQRVRIDFLTEEIEWLPVAGIRLAHEVEEQEMSSSDPCSMDYVSEHRRRARETKRQEAMEEIQSSTKSLLVLQLVSKTRNTIVEKARELQARRAKDKAWKDWRQTVLF